MEERVPLDSISGRKMPARGVRISSQQPTILFVTVCAKDRVPWIAQDIVRNSLEEVWRKADAWLVGCYLLMPDHIHLFCAPRDLRFTAERWLAFWKREFTRRHLDQDWEWQRGGYHHRLRNEEAYRKKWQYVYENPVRAGLVKSPEEWPHQGTIHELRW